MKTIKLGKSELLTMVSDIDYPSLSLHKWCYQLGKNGNSRVQRNAMVNGKRITLSMHRVILGVTDPKILVDHIDGNPLNNQRENLREANHSQNCANGKRYSNATGKYKGVVKSGKGYTAQCRKNGKYHYKYCKTEKEAAIAYNEMGH